MGHSSVEWCLAMMAWQGRGQIPWLILFLKCRLSAELNWELEDKESMILSMRLKFSWLEQGREWWSWATGVKGKHRAGQHIYSLIEHFQGIWDMAPSYKRESEASEFPGPSIWCHHWLRKPLQARPDLWVNEDLNWPEGVAQWYSTCLAHMIPALQNTGNKQSTTQTQGWQTGPEEVLRESHVGFVLF